METWRIVIGSIMSLLAILIGIYVSFTARKKGPILSNTYIWFSDEERKKIDRNHEYRLVTITYGGLFAAILCDVLYIFTKWRIPFILMFVFIVFIIVYAIIDSVKTSKKVFTS